MFVLENWVVQGDIIVFGGVCCLMGDQIVVLCDFFSDKFVKNIILLIGDGMGDLEIIVVCNYVQGVGGFFKGIDVLLFIG